MMIMIMMKKIIKKKMNLMTYPRKRKKVMMTIKKIEILPTRNKKIEKNRKKEKAEKAKKAENQKESMMKGSLRLVLKQRTK